MREPDIDPVASKIAMLALLAATDPRNKDEDIDSQLLIEASVWARIGLRHGGQIPPLRIVLADFIGELRRQLDPDHPARRIWDGWIRDKKLHLNTCEKCDTWILAPLGQVKDSCETCSQMAW